MNVLVTGAAGFLGRRIVAALSGAGHRVRALVRSPAAAAFPAPAESIEVVAADLGGPSDLAPALRGIEAVIHLAASMSGSHQARYAETVRSSARLFDAIDRSPVRRVLLCSSFAVYDWLQAHRVADETLPLKRGLPTRDYAGAKLWQERAATERSAWRLTILRPGFIWGGEGGIPRGCLGPKIGPLQLVVSPGRVLPLTYVLNCADAFRAALENPRSIGEAVNIVDDAEISAWEFAGRTRRGALRPARVPVPHALAWPAVRALARLSKELGWSAQLPSMLAPERFAQVFRPLRFSTEKQARVLGWRSPLSFRSALANEGLIPAAS